MKGELKEFLTEKAAKAELFQKLEMPMNLAVSKNKNLFEELWFKIDEVDKIDFGEDQSHLEDLNYTDTNTARLGALEKDKCAGSPFKG